jgi:prepilin-type N-terminal cleavage/methylation domain-containing protein
MKKNVHSFLFNRNAFTIIELLVVVGIISILAIALLVTLNPTEAQKKSRDAKRLKDASTMQAILESYIADGGAPFCTTACTSAGGTAAANSQPCGATNWMSTDLCEYAQSVPSDPINQAARTCATWSGTPAVPAADNSCDLYYQVMMLGSDYEINVRQESLDNADKLMNDPGSDVDYIEIISNSSNELI